MIEKVSTIEFKIKLALFFVPSVHSLIKFSPHHLSLQCTKWVKIEILDISFTVQNSRNFFIRLRWIYWNCNKMQNRMFIILVIPENNTIALLNNKKIIVRL